MTTWSEIVSVISFITARFYAERAYEIACRKSVRLSVRP